MEVRKSDDRPNTPAEHLKSAREVNLKEPTKNLVTSFRNWAGPVNNPSDDWILFMESLASGATVHTAIARIGMSLGRFSRFVNAEGDDFERFRTEIQKAISGAMMFAEQKLQEKNPWQYIKMMGKYMPRIVTGKHHRT